MKAKKRPAIIECFVLGSQYPDWFAEKVTDLTEKIESWLTVPKNKVKLMSA
ncbi:TPA: hypothetical protein IUZ21_002562, partial [Enterococcus faecalis]|nr:hypothetical protein [Enterococcus faecalis]